MKDDDAPRRHPIRGSLAVCAEPCETCPWVGRMKLAPGGLQAHLEDTIRQDCHFVCHKAVQAGVEVVCRGWYEKTMHMGTGNLVRIMGRMGGLIATTPEGVPVPGAPRLC